MERVSIARDNEDEDRRFMREINSVASYYNAAIGGKTEVNDIAWYAADVRRTLFG